MLRSLAHIVVLGAALVGCGSTIEPVPGEQPDASMSNPGDIDASAPDADVQAVRVDLTHLESKAVIVDHEVACAQRNNGVAIVHRQNRYFREFRLANDHGIDSPLAVDAVEFGIEKSVPVGGTQPVVVKLHARAGALDGSEPTLSELTELASVSADVSSAQLTIQKVTIRATVPAGDNLVVEIAVPDGAPTGDLFLIGGNESAELRQAYINSEPCSFVDMTPWATIGLPTRRPLITASGAIQ